MSVVAQCACSNARMCELMLSDNSNVLWSQRMFIVQSGRKPGTPPQTKRSLLSQRIPSRHHTMVRQGEVAINVRYCIVRMCACLNTGTDLDPVRTGAAVGCEGGVSKDTGDMDPKPNVNGSEAKETSEWPCSRYNSHVRTCAPVSRFIVW